MNIVTPFFQQCTRTPNHLAFFEAENQLSYSELKEIAAELKVKEGKDVKKIIEKPRLGLFGGMFSSNKENLKTSQLMFYQ